MSKFVIPAIAFAAIAFGGIAQASTPAHSGAAHPDKQSASHAPRARITMAQARATALRAAPGKVSSSEYEKEGGGWRYSFDIQQRNNVQEIGVDGQSGKIVENKSEGPKDRD